MYFKISISKYPTSIKQLNKPTPMFLARCCSILPRAEQLPNVKITVLYGNTYLTLGYFQSVLKTYFIFITIFSANYPKGVLRSIFNKF